jgi:hypothetical protein
MGGPDAGRGLGRARRILTLSFYVGRPRLVLLRQVEQDVVDHARQMDLLTSSWARLEATVRSQQAALLDLLAPCPNPPLPNRSLGPDGTSLLGYDAYPPMATPATYRTQRPASSFLSNSLEAC